MTKKKPILLGILLVVLLVVSITGVYLIRKYTPSKSHMKLSEYFKAAEGQTQVILEDMICDVKAVTEDGQVYVDAVFVKDSLNKRFYWDDTENKLLYTTSTAVISSDLNSQDVYTNNSKSSREYAITKTDGDTVYIALDFVQEYTALDYKKYDKPDRVVIHNVYNKDISHAKVKKDSALRYKANIKSKVLVDLKKDEKIRVIEKVNPETRFFKAMSESGVIGYVREKDAGDAFVEQATTDFQEETYSHILMDEKVNLVWHQVTNQTANSRLSSLLEETKGVNVVSPTWFETSDNEGNISSLASDSYVTTAHRAGVKVWALCNDFSPNMKIGKVLGVTSKRQKLAKNLIAEAIRYSLDGINIDFENVKQESGEDFIQFIRELGIMCRNNGIILSVDNYPLKSFNAYYNREEQAQVADYVVTMAYDEFYAGSEKAGPVSSISYVTDAISAVLEEVPAEQNIVALPFYSRHWTEKTKNGKASLSSEACSMEGAQDVVRESGKDAAWDDKTGMNYLEYTSNKAIHKIWIEDAKSLELKMKAVAEAQVGGMAFWKLGLEQSAVWETIVKYTK